MVNVEQINGAMPRITPPNAGIKPQQDGTPAFDAGAADIASYATSATREISERNSARDNLITTSAAQARRVDELQMLTNDAPRESYISLSQRQRDVQYQQNLFNRLDDGPSMSLYL